MKMEAVVWLIILVCIYQTAGYHNVAINDLVNCTLLGYYTGSSGNVLLISVKSPLLPA
jgi:hypothetical protein